MNRRFHEIPLALLRTNHKDESFGGSQLETTFHTLPEIAFVDLHLLRTGTSRAVSVKWVSDQASQIFIVHIILSVC